MDKEDNYFSFIYDILYLSIELGMIKKSFLGFLKPSKKQVGWIAGFIDASFKATKQGDDKANIFTTKLIFAKVFNDNSLYEDLSKNQDLYIEFMLEGAKAYNLFAKSSKSKKSKDIIGWKHA